MAGTNQAVNLSGMLSQIGSTLGAPVDMSGLTRNIQNMARPEVDPNDPDSLRKLMEFQNKMGRTDEAAITMAQVRDMDAKQKEAKAKKEGQARAMAISQYEKALQVGDPDAIAAAEDAVRKVGEVQGIDVTGLLAGVEQRSFAQTNQAYQEQERVRLGEERAREAAEDKMVDQLAVAMNGATSIDQLDALLEGAPVEAAAQANVLYERATTRIDKAQTRAEAEQEAKATLQTVELILPDEGIPETTRKGYTKRVEALNTRIAEVNQQIKNGDVMLAKTTRQQLVAERRALENQMYQLSDSVALSEFRDQRSETKDLEKKVRDLELTKRAPYRDNDEINRVAKIMAGVDKEGEPRPVTLELYSRAKLQLVKQRNSEIDQQIRFLRGEEVDETAEPQEMEIDYGIKVGTIDEGMRYLGGDPNDKNNWEPQSRQWDRDKVKSIRSKISPMGTYTQ